MYKTASKFLNRSTITLPIPPEEFKKENLIKVCPTCKITYLNSYRSKCYICNSITVKKSGDEFLGEIKFKIIKIFFNEFDIYCKNDNMLFSKQDICIDFDPKIRFEKSDLENFPFKFIIIKFNYIPLKITITRIISVKLLKKCDKSIFYSKLNNICV
jgi:hypothetical protein